MSKALELPDKLNFKVVSGKDFVSLKSAAKLAGIHPAILEMGRELLTSPDGKGAQFTLGTPEMKKRAPEIEDLFRKGLKKIAQTDGTALSVKSYRDDEKIVFWYAVTGWSRKSKDK